MNEGYHVFKDLCTNPDYDEEFECVCEPDAYAVAVKKEISGDAVVVGHILDQYFQYFLHIYKTRWHVTYIRMHPAAIYGFLKLLRWPS